jgi:hypothetical protein
MCLPYYEILTLDEEKCDLSTDLNLNHSNLTTKSGTDLRLEKCKASEGRNEQNVDH